MALWRRNIHLRRYRQIAGVFVRHGLGFLVDILGIERYVPWCDRLPGPPGRGEALTRPARLRIALGELGTTFIKLGQILSTRAAFLPSTGSPTNSHALKRRSLARMMTPRPLQLP